MVIQHTIQLYILLLYSLCVHTHAYTLTETGTHFTFMFIIRVGFAINLKHSSDPDLKSHQRLPVYARPCMRTSKTSLS